ncbi:ankyrin repeat-containing domain protein [Neocallimastix lanati (nom. inval.)]|nr:ankyrin repeat-containing domain protein [Neocallimastix sp. JGI-2020a]
MACRANSRYDNRLSIKLIKFLIENGADINGKDNEGNTVIMYACDGCSPDNEVVKYLIDNKVDIHAKNKKGETVLSYAQKNNNTKIAKAYKKNEFKKTRDYLKLNFKYPKI